MTHPVPQFMVCIENELARGTGFVIADQVIATCAHVVRDILQLRHPDEDITNINQHYEEADPVGQPILTTFTALEKRPYPTTVQVYDWRNDIAILQGNAPLPPNARIAKLCSPNDLHPPIAFYTIGFRHLGEKREGTISTGELLGAALQASGASLQLKTEEMDSGMSGSPLYIPAVDRVVGIISDNWDKV